MKLYGRSTLDPGDVFQMTCKKYYIMCRVDKLVAHLRGLVGRVDDIERSCRKLTGCSAENICGAL